MFCTNCGAEVQGGQVYCPTCGKQVTMAKAKSQVSSQSSYNYQSTYSSQNPYNSQRSNMTSYYTKKKSNKGAALVVTFLVVAVLGVVVYGTVSIMGALHEVSVAKNNITKSMMYVKTVRFIFFKLANLLAKIRNILQPEPF